MAKEDRDEQTSEKWEGWCELHNVNVSLTDDGVVSTSRNLFEVEALINKKLSFTMEYSHVLEKWNGHAWEEVGRDTKPDVKAGEQGGFTCPRLGSYGHYHIEQDRGWSPNRSVTDPNGEAGNRYKLWCYVQINPVNIGGRTIEVKVEGREFPV